MIDTKDCHTVDGLPKKLGRPCLDPEQGPLTSKQRQQAYRDGHKIIQFRVNPLEKEILDDYCRSHELIRDELLSIWIGLIDGRDHSLPIRLQWI